VTDKVPFDEIFGVINGHSREEFEGGSDEEVGISGSSLAI
jgi:hypothetical protein